MCNGLISHDWVGGIHSKGTKVTNKYDKYFTLHASYR